MGEQSENERVVFDDQAQKQAALEERTAYENMLLSVAEDILNEAHTALVMSFRFLDTALWRLPRVLDWNPLPLATDARNLYANPLFLVARFQEGFNEVVRDYLHALLHCVFRHPLDEDHINVAAWSLTCDIMVETIALDMTENRYPCDDDSCRLKVIKEFEERMGRLSPLKLYRVFADAEVNGQRARDFDLSAAKVWDLRQLFQRDNHDLWANSRKKNEGDEKSDDDIVRKRNLSDRLQDQEHDQPPEPQEQEVADMDDDEKDQPQPSPDNERDESEREGEGEEEQSPDLRLGDENGQQDQGEETIEPSQDLEQDDADGDSSAEGSLSEEDLAQLQKQMMKELQENKEAWEEIAKQIEMDLESFSQGQGNKSDSLSAALSIANKRQANYGDFLRQFATMGEDMKINDDEFDYIYYTFGLKTYGNMPLVEPLEYQESYRVREFVIALDTSGSCSGELIRQFVTRTYDILRETEGFGDKVNIHLIQCDNKVQADLKIERVEDLEKYCRDFTVFGFGGTDFRPVFTYVDELQEKGEFENLQGLIYFTDGLGTFPTQPTSYETAFVFMDDGSGTFKVPPWAMKVVMDEEEVRSL